MALFSQIAFVQPLALLALVLLPVIWWLLRFTPPRPEQVRFPPLRLLLGLVDREETPHKSPWWLTVLRTAAAALLIIGFAQPVLNPGKKLGASDGLVLVIVDDGWAAAARWGDRLAALGSILTAADFAGRQVALLTTTPALNPPDLKSVSAQNLTARARALVPQPLKPQRLKLATALEARYAKGPAPDVLWLSDGLDYGAAKEFASRLAALGGGAARLRITNDLPGKGPLALKPPKAEDGGLTVEVLRQRTGAERTGQIRAMALNGRPLSEATFTFKPGQNNAKIKFDLPLDLRNQLGRIEIAGQRSPAARYLFDDRWRRNPVGLIASQSDERSQPLLSPLHYVERALGPYAEVRRPRRDDNSSAIAQLIEQGLSVLVLADIGRLRESDEELTGRWVRKGGVLVRFAGPRLANANDRLVPVALRRGGRALGGALSWTKPQRLSAFPVKSPFAGLAAKSEITVRRQVLAEPAPDLEAKTWARLSDGTPLVTAETRGSGMIVLFHVPANPGWSNLPLSGLFVEMLRRIVDLSAGVTGSGTEQALSPVARLQVMPPVRTLDGFGRLQDPPGAAEPVRASEFGKIRPAPRHPPGLYGSPSRYSAINVGHDKLALRDISGALAGTYAIEPYTTDRAQPLKAWLLLTAFALLLLDGIAVLFLSGRLRILRHAAAASAIACAVIFGATAGSGTAFAQSSGAPPPAPSEKSVPEKSPQSFEFAIRATRQTHLAYVITGSAKVDAISRAGLDGLSDVLRQRTALEPGAPIGINLESDELAFFPFIYWPVVATAEPLSEKVLARVSAFMKNGGTILFDTRDNQQALKGVDGDLLTPQTRALRRILGKLDIPALEVVPPDHVLTKAFYLLQDFPGRWADGQLWVEARPGTAASPGDQRRPRNPDGVSAIIIGANDYAAAWAVDSRRRNMFPVVPGGARQREMAYRTGINIVLYALTGNYKADQVHIPALLERLGQ